MMKQEQILHITDNLAKNKIKNVMMHYFNPLLQHIFSTKTLTGPILFCLPS